MNQAVLSALVERRLSTREIAKQVGLSQTGLRHWLKTYSLKTSPKLSEHYCQCGETDPKKFYGNRKNYCAKCTNRDSKRYSDRNRDFAIQELGGKCLSCGFSKFRAALQVHHLDPSIKSPTFRRSRKWSLDRLANEIKHCVLLCANCHAALHSEDESIIQDILAQAVCEDKKRIMLAVPFPN